MSIKAKILAVDDEERNLRLLEALLEPRGYQISQAKDGDEALEQVHREPPDLVLLDVMMPKTDGFEVCRQMKQNPASANIPVIFITSRTDTDSIVEGFESGGIDYITKPFNKAELLARITTHIALKRSQENLEKRTEELAEKNTHLEEALAQVKELKGLLPICSYCKKIRDDSGYWNQLETYVKQHSHAEFSHGICPGCLKKQFPEYYTAAVAKGLIQPVDD